VSNLQVLNTPPTRRGEVPVGLYRGFFAFVDLDNSPKAVPSQLFMVQGVPFSHPFSGKQTMNIALVFPPFHFEPMYNMPPLGLINLATVLKGTPRHRVRIFDFPLAIRQKTLLLGKSIYDECARQILDFDPDLAGFSVQCTTYPPAVQVARNTQAVETGNKNRFFRRTHNASFCGRVS